MSKEVQELVNSHSDLLIRCLDFNCSDKLLAKLLKFIDETHQYIDQGLLK
jgi:hypothetical protein